MADTITNETAVDADTGTDAAAHLGYISAIADLVRTFVEVAGTEALENLEPSTLEDAMLCITHHVDTVRGLTS